MSHFEAHYTTDKFPRDVFHVILHNSHSFVWKYTSQYSLIIQSSLQSELLLNVFCGL